MIVLPTPTLAGRFKLDAMKADGRVRPLAGWFDNMILDVGLDRIADAGDYLDCCHVGASAAPVLASQTILQAPIAATNNRAAANSAATNAAPFSGRSSITYQFATGAVSGTIREVGIGRSTTLTTDIFSRALTPNAYGDAAEIEVFSDETLQVQYELSVNAPTADAVGSFIIDDVTYAYTARAALASTGSVWCPYRASAKASAAQAVRALFGTTGGALGIAYSGSLGAVTASPTGSSANCISGSNTTYVSGSFQRGGTLRWDDTVANYAGGVKSAMVYFANTTGDGGNSLGAYQIEFTPAIPKDNTKSMLIDLVWGWSRA